MCTACSKSKVSGMKKGNKIPTEMFAGVAVGAGASGVVGSQLMKIQMVAENPMYVGLGKAILGGGIFMYSGKSQFGKGVGIGLLGAGASDLTANLWPAAGVKGIRQDRVAYLNHQTGNAAIRRA